MSLKWAVANGELFLEYQPQRHAGGEVIGFEALVRWQHPQRGMIPPAEFILVRIALSMRPDPSRSASGCC